MLRILLPTVAALLLVAGLLYGAAPARAETVRLRSGKTLEVDGVRVLADRIRITLRRDGGTARVDLPFARLDAAGLLDLLDRHTDPQDASARLRTARVALDRGLHAEAAQRFRAAAALDPALGPARDEGLAAIRALEARAGLVELELRLRAGADPHAAMALAAALLDGPVATGLTPAQRVRVRALGDLARRLFKRDQQRAARRLLAQAAAAGTPEGPAAGPAASPDPGGALGVVRAGLAGYEATAEKAREAAADPQLAPVRVVPHLEAAATALQRARRLLRGAPKALQAPLAARAQALRRTLVATYLELADLYRRLGRFDDARARVRVVLILDPGNEDAWDQRARIEDDLRRDPVFDDDRGRGFQTYYYSPSPFRRWTPWPYGGARPTYFGAGYHGRRGWFTLHLGHGFGAGTQRHGARRVVGTRR